MYGGGVWGSGPQIDKHLSQGPFTGKFFLDDEATFCFDVDIVTLGGFIKDEYCS